MRLANWLIPELQLRSLYELDPHHLRQRGIKGVITNLDRVLSEPGHAEPLQQWVHDLRAAGLKLVIVSNLHRAQISHFARPLGIPFVCTSRQPLARALRLLRTDQGETAVIGHGLLTDIYGGNRTGLFTIWITAKTNRFFQRILYNYVKKKIRIPQDVQ